MLPGSSLILTRIAPVRNYIGKFFRETPLLTYMLWCRSLCPQEGGTFYSHRQKKDLTNPPLLGIITLSFADLAHLVERHLAKVEVASSSLVIRSNKESKAFCLAFFVLQLLRDSNRATRQGSNSPGDCCGARVRAGARRSAPGESRNPLQQKAQGISPCAFLFVVSLRKTRTGQLARVATVRGTVAMPACVPVRAEAHRASLVIRSNKKARLFALLFLFVVSLRKTRTGKANRLQNRHAVYPAICARWISSTHAKP